MIISANKNKYCVNKMCKMLNISRSYYYKLVKLKSAIVDNKNEENNKEIVERIESIYKSSRRMYGSRKISACLAKEDINLSPYKTLKIMKAEGLSSLYNKKKRYKPYSETIKQSMIDVSDKIEQKFTTNHKRKVVTSDLTYVPLKTSFVYICFVIDLYNREILTYGVSCKHDANFIYETLTNINLNSIEIFHSDRGKEFLNHKIHNLLKTNDVEQSASRPGCPYDNAVSENLFGIFKREWMKREYQSIEEVERDVSDFVNNYNYFRVHSTLNYQSPVEYRLNNSI